LETSPKFLRVRAKTRQILEILPEISGEKNWRLNWSFSGVERSRAEFGELDEIYCGFLVATENLETRSALHRLLRLQIALAEIFTQQLENFTDKNFY